MIYEDRDEVVFNWVIENLNNNELYKNNLTLSIVYDNMVIAGIIYSIKNKICYLSIFSVNPKWVYDISKIFKRAFEFDVKKVICRTSENNDKINRLLSGLGLNRRLAKVARLDGSRCISWSITQEELIKKRWFKCQGY